jgi:hypothetical protein
LKTNILTSALSVPKSLPGTTKAKVIPVVRLAKLLGQTKKCPVKGAAILLTFTHQKTIKIRNGVLTAWLASVLRK